MELNIVSKLSALFSQIGQTYGGLLAWLVCDHTALSISKADAFGAASGQTRDQEPETGNVDEAGIETVPRLVRIEVNNTEANSSLEP